MRPSAPLLLCLAIAPLLLAPHAAEAQRTAPRGDSISWVAAREAPERARQALLTRDRHAAVLLTDSTVVLQLTDAGLRHTGRSIREDTASGVGGALLRSVLGGMVTGLLDHGIAHRLSALSDARAEGGRLVLVGHDGEPVFGRVEMNGRNVMEDFAPAEAERFAAAVRRAIRARR
jgi:photosystem II stability/assembly factor-like uncharacterized protein